MKVYTILHNDSKPNGAIEAWVDRNGFELRQISPYAGEALPELERESIVIVMGGEQSATQLERHPFLKDEIAFIQQAERLGLPVLGICLGAQLMALAFGGRVYEGEQREIGSFPVNLTESASQNPLFAHWPSSPKVFQWHFDYIELPKHANLYASSAACPVQAFSINERLIGLQFHLELTRSRVQKLIDKLSGHLENPGAYTQEADEMLQADFSTMNGLLLSFLEQWKVQLVAGSTQ